MAALLPKWQKYIDVGDGTGTRIGIHIVKLQSASDTLTVEKFNQTTTGDVSAATLRRADAATATITDNADSDGNTVTIVGTAGQTVLIVTVHGPRNLNYGDED